MLSLVGLFALLAVPAVCQTVQTVDVGDSGSFFTPATISAFNGTIVRFVFTGRTHTVTQSSFEAPCSPLAGGFNSGPAGVGTNASAPPPIWDLHITNDSEPIWFFCSIVQPSSHCAEGMVGGINVPSIAQFALFTQSAKLVTGTPAPSQGVTLTGVDAFATNSPAPTPTLSFTLSTTSTTTSSSSSSSSSSSASPSATAAASSSSSDKGSIIGGAIGGAVAILVVGILAFMLYQAKQRQASAARGPDTMERFDPSKSAFIPPQPTGTSGGGEMIAAQHPTVPMLGYNPNAYNPNAMRAPGSEDPYNPYARQAAAGNYDAALPPRNTMYSGSTHQIDATEPMSIASETTRVSHYTDGRGDVVSSGSHGSPASPPVDAKEIAKEVAVYLENRLRASPNQAGESGIQAPNPHRPLPAAHGQSGGPAMTGSLSPGPPEYGRYR